MQDNDVFNNETTPLNENIVVLSIFLYKCIPINLLMTKIAKASYSLGLKSSNLSPMIYCTFGLPKQNDKIPYFFRHVALSCETHVHYDIWVASLYTLCIIKHWLKKPLIPFLMACRHKERGHQQPSCCPNLPGTFLLMQRMG